jgi:hypothetical protein
MTVTTKIIIEVDGDDAQEFATDIIDYAVRSIQEGKYGDVDPYFMTAFQAKLSIFDEMKKLITKKAHESGQVEMTDDINTIKPEQIRDKGWANVNKRKAGKADSDETIKEVSDIFDDLLN